MPTPYEMFKTDPELEKNGVKIDYGEFYLVLARAGGANTKFAAVLERLLKPYRRALQTDTMDNKVADRVMKEAYAEAIVLGWGSTMHGKGKMPDESGNAMTCTKENVIKFFNDLPDLWIDAQQQAKSISIYRQTVMEEDAKN